MARGWKNFRGQVLIEKTQDALAEAMIELAEETGTRADRIVPHDEGWLQGSKFIDSDPANPLIVKIGYGGGGSSGHPVVPYAVRWHEEEANFQKNRKNKYLADPLKEVAGTANNHIKSKMAKVWK